MTPHLDERPPKRGRPAKYNSHEQRKEEYAKRRRIQRQQEGAKRRGNEFDQFYGVGTPVAPALPDPTESRRIDRAGNEQISPITSIETDHASNHNDTTYAKDSIQEKATANAELEGVERHEESENLDESRNYPHFPSYPSVLPPLRSQPVNDDCLVSEGGIGAVNMSTGLRLRTDNSDYAGLGDIEITQFLLPPSPPLQSAEDYIADDETSPGSSSQSPLLVASTGGVSPTAIIDVADDDSSLVANTDRDDRVHHLAHQLASQLTKFRGCCADCHRTAKSQHYEESREHISIAAYLRHTAALCPEILGSASIASPEDNLTGKISTAIRRQIYCGLQPGDVPSHICIGKDERVTNAAGISFDVDSITGFPHSLAVAKQGIRWFPTRMPVSDLRSDLHLRPRQVQYFDAAGNQREAHRPVHQIPHYTFGRLIGFEDVSIYFLFPCLYREEQQSSRLRDEDFRAWMDGVLLPIIHEHYSSSHAQHYPSSYDHSRYNATARGVETRAQQVHPVAREQQLMYYLPPESLEAVWNSILGKVQCPGFQQFRDVTILLQAKNLKVLTKDVTWKQMVARFQTYLINAVDESHITEDFYFDIGKETCAQQTSHVISSVVEYATDADNDGFVNAPAETLLYRRCCLESYASWARSAFTAGEAEKQVFYPFSMLQDTGNLTIETGKRSSRRAAGLLYTQFYPSVKEVFAAGNVYPFTNTAIETLALDKKLRRTWELVGGGLSHQPAALMKAYLYTKLRCHHALLGSTRKSFGIREEHRVSKDLFYAIDGEFHVQGLQNQHFLAPTDENSPYYSFTTDTILRWLRWNINKFCVGFEMLYSFQDPHFVTWEHTRMMLMFLRCLQFSYSGGLIQKIGGCWQDVRHQPDPQQPNGLRRYEGLGFQRTMETYGYAWFLDKVDWTTLTFRQPHAAYMMFNNPSMQAAYHARYRQIRDVRIDFIRVDKATVCSRPAFFLQRASAAQSTSVFLLFRPKRERIINAPTPVPPKDRHSPLPLPFSSKKPLNFILHRHRNRELRIGCPPRPRGK